MRLAGHVECIDAMRVSYTILIVKPEGNYSWKAWSGFIWLRMETCGHNSETADSVES
jgi:hypothetical protein